MALEGFGTGSRERVSSTWGSSADPYSSFSFRCCRVLELRLRVCALAGVGSCWRGALLSRVQPLNGGTVPKLDYLPSKYTCLSGLDCQTARVKDCTYTYTWGQFPAADHHLQR